MVDPITSMLPGHLGILTDERQIIERLVPRARGVSDIH
jgi:hypothetical protein